MEYAYIYAWGKMLNSLPGFIDAEIEKAKRDHAPQTAIFQRQDGSWATFEGIENETSRSTVAAIVRKMQQEAQHGK